jgi:archaellum component FlaC
MNLTSEDIQLIQEAIKPLLTSQLSVIENRFEKVENRLEKVENRLEKVENRLETIETDVSSIKKDVAALAIINQLDEIKKDSRLSRVLQLQV